MNLYTDILNACERALEKFNRAEDLLTYPEVQADKADYLSALKEYNRLLKLKELKARLEHQVTYERDLIALLDECKSQGDLQVLYGELKICRFTAMKCADAIASELGCKRATESAYCRMRFSDGTAAETGVKLCALLKKYFLGRGGKVTDGDKSFSRDGTLRECSFTVTAEGALGTLMLFSGVHGVGANGQITVASTYAPTIQDIDERDLKIDYFHSNGAGGQNINKVETAVRITHLPTGIVVTCQDERSQLANKKRALETISERLRQVSAAAEKQRVEAELNAQSAALDAQPAFDGRGKTMTDSRLSAFLSVEFPMAELSFAAYVNALLSI